MADNCGMCLELPEKYKCGWCYDQCDVEEKCIERHKESGQSIWLNKQQTCPDPRILDFDPKSGPYEGGTNITIKGVNLGRNFEDIASGVSVAQEKNGVTIGLIACIPIKELYIKTKQITCQIREPNITRSMANSIEGPVLVKVQNDFQARSKDHFHFVSPLITSIDPTSGPKSGGTLLRIWGLHMNAGSTAEAMVGPYPCKVTRRDMNSVECITSAAIEAGHERVMVRFDYGERSFESYHYSYLPDPVILAVESGSGQKFQPKGIPSGGIRIFVKGSNLKSVKSPKFFVEVAGERYTSACLADTDSFMKCKSPSVPIDKLNFADSDEYVELHYGFIMDNVLSVQELTKRRGNPFARFRMFRNPEIHRFNEPERIKYYKSDYLTINVSKFYLFLSISKHSPIHLHKYNRSS